MVTQLIFLSSDKRKPQVIYKPHCHSQNFSPLANGVYLIAIINKTTLGNGNCPITNVIAEMRVAHTGGHNPISCTCQMLLKIKESKRIYNFYFWTLKKICSKKGWSLCIKCKVVHCKYNKGFFFALFSLNWLGYRGV